VISHVVSGFSATVRLRVNNPVGRSASLLGERRGSAAACGASASPRSSR